MYFKFVYVVSCDLKMGVTLIHALLCVTGCM